VPPPQPKPPKIKGVFGRSAQLRISHPDRDIVVC
jgi:hypothetical protein